MNYDKFFINALDVLKQEGRYRVFNDIKRISGKFPNAVYFSGNQEKKIVVWCSNDYLGMGQKNTMPHEPYNNKIKNLNFKNILVLEGQLLMAILNRILFSF